MKRIIVTILTLAMLLSLAACVTRENTQQTDLSGSDETNAQEIESSPSELVEGEAETPITLTIGNIVLEGYLNESVPAQSLLAQLPLTVTLSDSDNDFCGGNLDIAYSEANVTSGYRNGDITFWTPANNLVIFVSDEENSENTGNLVNLGHITSPQEMLDALEGTIEVTIDVSEEGNANTSENTAEAEIQEGAETVQVKITAGDSELLSEWENSATTQALIEQMPMTLSMLDLYGREMCYRYGAYALPTDTLRADGYEVGDIAYWPPGGSLVILYEQNGENFERQHIGHIESGVEIFKETGATDVTFEVVS